MLQYLDSLLDRITMYRLTLYYLLALLAVALGFTLSGQLSFSPFALAFSAGFLTIIAWLSNKVFAYVYDAPVNTESVYITALILALIVNPIKTSHDIVFLTAVAGLAIASKFILAYRKKHIFNPAAVAVVLTALGPGQAASWWVGSSAMLPFVLVGGLILARKIQRESMLVSYFASVIVSTVIISVLSHHAVWPSLEKTLLHSSLFFLAFVMLTEPLTSPPTKNKQSVYAVIAGALFSPQIHLFGVYSTPELTLLIANVYAYIVSPKVKAVFSLHNKEIIAPDIVEFSFKPAEKLRFKPGQYMEWTLPHNNTDSRGNRRYFTLASSPTEDEVLLGVKFYEGSSSYKKAIYQMEHNSRIAAGSLAGDFVLPDDESKKLVFIAGGIGVTPYRSMIKFLTDTNTERDVVLMYSDKTPKHFVYTDIFSEARHKWGLKTIYTLTDNTNIPTNWQGQTGHVSARIIRETVPDFNERMFYVSGSLGMVQSVTKALHTLGVPDSQIKTDYFPSLV